MQNFDSVFETTRLVAARWSPDFAEQALAIYGDLEVTKYIPGMEISDIEQMREKIHDIIMRDEKMPVGMGSFPVFLKTTGTMVGTALIRPLPDARGCSTDQVEIGWHLARRQWGRGYATEYGERLIQIGFLELNLPELHAFVDTPNEKSRKVASRLGMELVGQRTRFYDGERVDHFLVRKK